MRGYSIFYEHAPIVVLNPKDSPEARSFTLLHELTHLMLRSQGICNLEESRFQDAAHREVERFCNAAAGLALVPGDLLRDHATVKRGPAGGAWEADDLASIARDFSVSLTVIARRLFELERLENETYHRLSRLFQRQAREKAKKKPNGGPPPETMTLSRKGKPFVRLVLDGLNTDVISPLEARDYLGLSAKWFGELQAEIS